MKEMKNTKKLMLVLCLTAALMMLFTACGGNAGADGENQGAALTCSLEVNCETALPHSDELSLELPSDGIVVSLKEVEFHEGDTAFDVFKKAMDDNGILFEYSEGIGGSPMIEGVCNLYNGDCGDMSGWLVIINDEMASVGVDELQLQEGDTFKLAYSCDCGLDLGFTY